MSQGVRIGVDTGGTFTDIILSRPDGTVIKKVPSRPDAAEQAIVDGFSDIVEPSESGSIVHGTTIATNALLSRTGKKTALVTTAGFEDILEIGRQNRPDLYDLTPRKPAPLVPRELVFGLDERMLHTGEILTPLTDDASEMLSQELEAAGARSVAICLLFSYANPAHELKVRQALEGLGISISISSDVLPAYREYERCGTTVVNAYVAPSITAYLSRLKEALNRWRIQIMQSNGGCISIGATCQRPVVTILSGPAGGAIGAQKLAAKAGEPRAISFDMGGTSTDVSLIAEGLSWSTETEVSGCPIAIPVIDIHTVGAGGGSIGYLDAGGALRVGPESAGADPGPACYGKGDQPTVTDANIVLGRLSPDWFLDGEFKIYPDRAHDAIDKLAAEMGISTEAAAEGMIRVANATMQRALSVVSVQRGFDPREFSIVAFGGAGPVHACDLCRAISARSVIVPLHPGILSAIGMLQADTVRDYKKSVLIPAEAGNLELLGDEFSALEEKAAEDLRADGVNLEEIRFDRLLEMRYVGQSYEISIPFCTDYLHEFGETYLQEYGYMDVEKPKEIVNVRLMAIVPNKAGELVFSEAPPTDGREPMIGKQALIERGESLEARLYRRDLLLAGERINGPAVVVEYSSTTYVPSDFSCEVDHLGNLVLRQNRA
ncbi:MAG: hydantoinase/oxoprolinase family protein [Candidatus Coatesbacteria bacterium]|nr:hydantoinase/oxoprolinase family protein [Candidatus Coatesbacteria bacterium]